MKSIGLFTSLSCTEFTEARASLVHLLYKNKNITIVEQSDKWQLRIFFKKKKPKKQKQNWKVFKHVSFS